jgi:hypothetical protein
MRRRARLTAGLLLAAAAARAEAAGPADEPAWRKLLHYKGGRSRADTPAFFFSPRGRDDPAAELEATRAAMADPARRHPPTGQHPQCAFPARHHFLRERAGFTAPRVACPDFEEWRDRLAARAVSLIFTSAYAENPASMFGHTLLRLDRGGGGPGSEPLLAYTVAFLAQNDPQDSHPVYAFKGLTGGYVGSYTIDPYYMTVAVYNDAENRDLWEYELALGPEQVDRLVEHLWELLHHGLFDYYFFDENCSYMLLALLEAAAPELDLLDETGVFVLPLETMRLLPVARRSFRPSLRRVMDASVAALTPEEDVRFRQLIEDDASLAGAPVKTLDALVAYWNFRKFEARNELPVGERQAMRRTLEARSGRPPVPAAPVARPSPPDEGHRAGKLSIGTDGTHGLLSAQMGLHDPLDDPRGYESFAAIDYLGITVRAPKPRIEAYKVIEVTALNPYSALDPQWSWRLAWFGEREGDALVTSAEAAGGGALHLFSEHGVVYALALANAESGVGLRPGALGGVLGRIGPVAGELELRSLPREARPDARGALAWSIETNWSLRLGWRQEPRRATLEIVHRW